MCIVISSKHDHKSLISAGINAIVCSFLFFVGVKRGKVLFRKPVMCVCEFISSFSFPNSHCEEKRAKREKKKADMLSF